jgi:hypothetical protein
VEALLEGLKFKTVFLRVVPRVRMPQASCRPSRRDAEADNPLQVQFKGLRRVCVIRPGIPVVYRPRLFCHYQSLFPAISDLRADSPHYVAV